MASEAKEAFFDRMAADYLALTYDDVRVDPARSDVAASETDIRSRFSRNVELNAPMVSAAMDTVTTAPMAIAMAKLGGLGVIHGGLSIDDQRREVRRVKLELNGLIHNPITVAPDRTVESVLQECDDRGFAFRTFPVVDAQRRLVGVLSGSDMEFCDSPQRTVFAVMTPRQEVRSVPVGTTVREAYQQMLVSKKKTLPVVDDDGVLQGMYLWSDVSRIVRGNAAQYNVDGEGRLRVAAAVPTDEEAVDRVRAMERYLDVAVIDTAQGDSRFAFRTLERLKEEFPGLDIVVGNISVAASARDLVLAGADGIKVGQGPGSICTTRIETGMGRPQLTAVHDCVRAVEALDLGVPVCADGGITNKGDVLVALAAGAHSVMMGSKLAGTDEAPGSVIVDDNGTKVMLYRGMGSRSALRDSAAARKRYGGSGLSLPLPEGVEAYVPYQGSVQRVLGEMILALRKGMSYVGAADITYLREHSTLTRVTNSGMRESHPHDVRVI